MGPRFGKTKRKERGKRERVGTWKEAKALGALILMMRKRKWSKRRVDEVNDGKWFDSAIGWNFHN